MREIRIYFEGGRKGKDLKPKFRKGFNDFFSEIVKQVRSESIHWHFILSYSRNEAFDNFQMAQKSNPDAFNILLIDSEDAVTKSTVCQYLKSRDDWATDESEEDHYHLMVQMMESWFLADKEALQKYYKQGFRMNALPGNPNVEEIPKEDVERALKKATASTQKGEYHKTKHGPDILSKLDSVKVRRVAPHCERLFRILQTVINS